jgi:release factor glutamine methyltransferase
MMQSGNGNRQFAATNPAKPAVSVPPTSAAPTPAPTDSTPAAPPADAWTTRRLRAWLTDAMKKNGIAEAGLCAELLLCHALSCEKLKLFTEADRIATDTELAKLRQLAGRALKHEPVQYLTGETYFFSLRIRCDRRALIPRHCTETLVEHILQHAARLAQMSRDARSGAASGPAPADPDPVAVDLPPEPIVKLFKRGRTDLPPLRIADLCTGTGCIALALAKNLPQATVVATDLHPDALALARENAEALSLSSRIEFRQGDLLAPLAGETFDVITANPPYIPDSEFTEVPSNVKDFEPHSALRGGSDGLQFVRPLLTSAHKHLLPGGILAVEIAAATADACVALLQQTGAYDAVTVLKDLDRHPRVVTAKRKA